MDISYLEKLRNYMIKITEKLWRCSGHKSGAPVSNPLVPSGGYLRGLLTASVVAPMVTENNASAISSNVPALLPLPAIPFPVVGAMGVAEGNGLGDGETLGLAGGDLVAVDVGTGVPVPGVVVATGGVGVPT